MSGAPNAFPCPYCGGDNVRRSRKHTIADWPKMLVGIYTFRCVSCEGRFSANIWTLRNHGFAKCPRCLRLDVVPWKRNDLRLTRWDRIRLGWGANSYRCMPCRRNFVSFQPCVVSALQEAAEEDAQDAGPELAD